MEEGNNREGEEQKSEGSLEKERAEEDQVKRGVDRMATPGIDAAGDKWTGGISIYPQPPGEAEVAEGNSVNEEGGDDEEGTGEFGEGGGEEGFLQPFGPERGAERGPNVDAGFVTPEDEAKGYGGIDSDLLRSSLRVAGEDVEAAFAEHERSANSEHGPSEQGAELEPVSEAGGVHGD